MSGWRIAVKTLYALGGTATSLQVETTTTAMLCVTKALVAAAQLGLVTSPGRRGGKWGRKETRYWRLTPAGEAFVEGRLQARHGPKLTGRAGAGRMLLVPTWTAVLGPAADAPPAQQLELALD